MNWGEVNVKRLSWYLLLAIAYLVGGLMAIPVAAWIRGGG